ncbi:protein deglycase DJ-1-like [Pseudomyrmex gracilis]|uniref:protein deglycase DJ-1-like n=1 Tax=Pseudomyrmex gracilis TaxID=219809 RepID=UPI000995A336|nr:protein deglycase DJ-1-like [Pseudomyrmex gracilis]
MTVPLVSIACLNFFRIFFRLTGKNFCTSNSNMAKKTAILLIAEGTEEMEAVITADILRRSGIAVTIASLTDNLNVKCSRDVRLYADTKFDAVKNQKYDAIILPGGLGGSKAFASSTELGKLLQDQEKENRVIAAICAAPTALKVHGIGKGKQITAYPSMKNDLAEYYNYLENKVVIDGNLITSKGPATAFAFGLAIVEKLIDKETATKVAKAALYEDYK